MARFVGAPNVSDLPKLFDPPSLASPARAVVGIKRAPGMNNERTRLQSRLPGGPEIESYEAVIIASIDATSAGLASDFGIGRCALTVGHFPNQLQHFDRGIVPRNTADRAAAQRTRAAQKHILVFGLHAPSAG